MAKKKRKTREELTEELLRTDPSFRRLKERIDYFRRKYGDDDRRASS
jgi:hypothetical protein